LSLRVAILPVMYSEPAHRIGMRLLMAVFYVAAGVFHIAAPEGFIAIVPPFVPFAEATVLITGLCEVAGAVGLLLSPFRRAAGIGLAVYAVCVFPANINHAINSISVAGLPTSWWYHGPRLAFQPVLVWWALYASGIANWPFSKSEK
jgi:uncharacterized membrane protein